MFVNDFSILDYLPFFVLKFLQLLANGKKVVEEGDVGLKSRILLPFLLENRQISIYFDVGTVNFGHLAKGSWLGLIV